jgi:hypothetical protein
MFSLWRSLRATKMSQDNYPSATICKILECWQTGTNPTVISYGASFEWHIEIAPYENYFS